MLLEWERDHPYAVGGGVEPVCVKRAGEGREVVVISDLHLGPGADRDGRYSGAENFFCDTVFSRFIDYLRREVPANRGLLVINGDIVDFLRITDLPESDAEFEEWRAMLEEIGIEKSVQDLRFSISPRERKFGFKTHDFKAAWRLRRSIAGHTPLFDALAVWLREGHTLTILKGNHDLELYWPAVRNTLRLDLAKRVAVLSGRTVAEALSETVLPALDFIDDAVCIDGDLYIEHGHRYDRYTFVVGNPVLKGGKELNLPFGSFFNRYLINRIESIYPFIDNVRPRVNILPLLIRERFPLALSILLKHIPMLRVIPKGYWRYMLERVFVVVLALILPLLGIGFLLWNALEATPPPQESNGGVSGFIARQGMALLSSIGGLILSYLLTRLVAYLQLEEPDSLNEFGRKILESSNYRIVTMGHTHNPDQFQAGKGWFYNSGTWIPIVENSSAEVRNDKTFCFLRLRRSPEGKLLPGHLQRWEDAADRGEPLTIVRSRE